MLPAQITPENIADLPLALSVHGLVELLNDGQVLHNSHAGVMFVIARQGEDTGPMVVLLDAPAQTYVITINRGTLKRLNVRASRSYWVDVRDTAGDIVAEARVHNDVPRPITATGRVTMTQALASTLAAGEKFCDGSMEPGSEAWKVLTATDTTAADYLPGRLIFKI